MSGSDGRPEVGENGCSIQVRDLNHYFGKGGARKQVLYDIELDARPGELIILTGPSGSGKTTLLTLIGALRSVQQGELKVMGQELKGQSQRQLVRYRRKLGIIFQLHNLFEALTAYQNVKMALELWGKSGKEADKLIEEMLTYLGLAERMYYKPDSLSGGQRQRVAVARALVNRPKIILADEPTAALDKKSGRDVVDLLKKMSREEGSTILMVTHDSRILDAADRIVNMIDGRIASDVDVQKSLTLCEFLMQSDLFTHLSPTQLNEVAQKMKTEKRPAGDDIIRQGDEGDLFYVIGEGAVDVIVDDGTGSKTAATIGRGDFFGEAALITEEPRNATCRAQEDCVLYTLGKADFKVALESSATFKEQLLKVLSQRQ